MFLSFLPKVLYEYGACSSRLVQHYTWRCHAHMSDGLPGFHMCCRPSLQRSQMTTSWSTSTSRYNQHSPTHSQFMFTHLQPVHVYTLTTCSCLHTYNLFMFTHLQTSWSYTYTNAFLIFQLLSCIKKCYKIFTHVLLA